MEDDKSTTDTGEDNELDDVEVTQEDLGVESEESYEDVDTDEEESEESDEEESEDETEEESTDESETKELTDAEKQKAFNKEMAEKRIAAKREREQALAEQQRAYVAEAGEDPLDTAVRQLQVDAYNNRVNANTNTLTSSYERAVRDFPILSDASPEIKAEVDAAIDAFQAMHVKLDAFGNPQEVSGDLYEYLQTKADSIQRLTQLGTHKQTAAKSKEKSKTLTVPSRAPKTSKKDPDLEAFDEEAWK